MKLLVVEQHPGRLVDLITLLHRDGHEVAVALVGQAISLDLVEIVLVDLIDPSPTAQDCARRLTGRRGGGFMPVLLITRADRGISLEAYLSSGAIDLIDQPTNPMLLRAKLAGLQRMCLIQEQLELHRQRLHHEVGLARHMFERIVDRSPRDIPGVRHWSLAAGHFSGDLLIYERTPAGELHILMGDFTGHGLAAAMGALPTADAFFAMSRKGRGIREIAGEINRKLHDLLPTGHFCAAALVRYAPARAELEVWSGGHPPILLLDAAHRVCGRIQPCAFPLGVVDAQRFEADTQVVDIRAASHILLCSDGLLDARNDMGEMFETRLYGGVLRAAPGTDAHPLERIKRGLIHFLDGLEPHDDISILTLDTPFAGIHGQAGAPCPA